MAKRQEDTERLKKGCTKRMKVKQEKKSLPTQFSQILLSVLVLTTQIGEKSYFRCTAREREKTEGNRNMRTV